MFNSKEIQQEYVYHNKEGLTLFEFIWRKGREDALNIDMEKPMHFTDEQKAWVKNYIIINAKRQRADAIDEFVEDIINKINFEEKWLLDCKSNNADTNIMFSALRTFVKNLKERNND